MGQAYMMPGRRWFTPALLVLCGVVAGSAAGGCGSPTHPTPSPTKPTPTVPSPAPSQQSVPPASSISGQVVVEIEHFSPFPNCGSCVPDLPGKVSLDGRVQSFDGPGWLVWADVADGVHTLKILAGNYGGSADCGFWFNNFNGDWQQTRDITVMNGQSTPVAIRFDCG